MTSALKLRLGTTFALAIALFVLPGCGGGGRTLKPWFYRFTNAIPNLSALDLYRDEVLVDAGRVYLSSTAYTEMNIEEPSFFFDMNEASTSNVVDSIVIDRVDNQSIHIIAIGTNAPGGGNPQPVARMVPIVITRTTPSGNARVIVVHGFQKGIGVQTPNVDIVRTGQIAPIIEDLEFGRSAVRTLTPGTYDFTIRQAGLLKGNIFTKTGVVLEAGKIYLFLLKGVEGSLSPFNPDITIVEEPPRDEN